MLNNKKNIPVINALRGIASLSVCWFHLTNGHEGFLSDGPIKLSGSFGWLGVEIFFVISGFILPYALFQGGYTIKKYFLFIAKRLTRLDPPYLASIILIILLTYLSTLSPLYAGKSFSDIVSPIQVLLHLGYLNAFFHYDWLNTVFWTLAIEFQYYLSIGLIFPLIISRNRTSRLFVLGILLTLSLVITSGNFIFHYLGLFIIGILAFQYRVGIVGRIELIIGLVVAIVCSLAVLDYPSVIAGMLTALIIITLNFSNAVFDFLGNISYSLYLLHVPIGGRVINLGSKLAHNDSMRVLFLLTAVALCLVSAYSFYRLIERPVQRISSSISYRKPNLSSLLLLMNWIRGNQAGQRSTPLIPTNTYTQGRD